MDTEIQETVSNVEGKEHVQRPKRRRNVTSYRDTKTRRSKSSSVLNAEDNNCSLSPTYSEKLKQYPTLGSKLKSCSDLLTERKNETRHGNEKYLTDLQRLEQQVTVKRTCSASDTKCGTNNFPRQEKQEKKCKRSSRHSLLFISKQLKVEAAPEFSNTKLEETNFCGQLMKLEKINKDVSLDSTIGKTDDEVDDVELEDPASSTTKQASCRRGHKRKQIAEQETEVSKKFGNKSSDLEDGKARKFRTRSKSVLDINRNDLLNEPLPISDNDYREFCTSTPIVKKSRGKRKELVNRSERYSSNISTTLPDPGVLSEMIIPLEASSLDVSSPTPIPVSKSDLPEPNNALELYSTLPKSVKSLESSLVVSSDASQDKSCFSDSADSSLAAIDQSADCDSDLPLGSTPVKLGKSFSVNDVVWVKWKPWPYLPCLVKQVYKQKKRLTLAVFGKNELPKNFTMGYCNQDSILRYWHPKKAEILAGAMSLSHEDRQKFHDSVAAAEKFLFVGSSLKDDTSLSEPWSCDQPDINNTTDCMDSSTMDAAENTREDQDNLDNVTSCENVNKCLYRKNRKSRNVACENADKVRISSQDSTPKQKVEEKAKSVNESLSMKGDISDASQDKSCFADSAESCLAEIEQSADSDSDEDLPLGFTPVKLDRSFSVNDVVWVKWKQWPYLPCLVKQVYKQKKRLTLACFEKNGLQENFTMGYCNQDSILRYWHPKKAEILAGAMSLSHEDRQKFHDSVAAAEKFLFVGSSLKDDTSLSEPWSCDQPDINNTTDCMDSSTMDAAENTREDQDNLDNVTSCENVNKCLNRKNGKNKNVACENADKVRISSQDSTPKQKVEEKAKSVNESLSMKGVIRKQKRSEQTKPLSDFMKSDAMKKYLAKIYKGEIESTLHDTFNSGSRNERLQLKHHGFGPIDDDDQIQTVFDVYLEWLQELETKKLDTKINYMIDVWFPEAVVYALRKIKQYSTKRAWTVYKKGVPRTKAELKNYFPEYVCNDKKRRFKSTRAFVEIDETELKDKSELQT